MISYSAYIPVYNCPDSITGAFHSLQNQTMPPAEVYAIDDGSVDRTVELVRQSGIEVVSLPSNLGRGAARAAAMERARYPFVVCCDSTNALALDFAERAVGWMDNPGVAAVFGRIVDSAPKGVAGRWRARHLFHMGQQFIPSHGASLITHGAMIRASAASQVGGFNGNLRHSEDADLGNRLLEGGFDVVGDPEMLVHCRVQNTVSEVLERHWRWQCGREEKFGLRTYLSLLRLATRVMIPDDLQARDPAGMLISALVPQYGLYRAILRALKGGRSVACF